MVPRYLFTPFLATLGLLLLFSVDAAAQQTIAEKKAGLGSNSDLSADMEKYLGQVNRELREWHIELEKLYAQVPVLYCEDADDSHYKELLEKINNVRDNIASLENSWRKLSLEQGNGDEYALWHQPETTLGQLVIDFGSQDYVYLMTPDIANVKVVLGSNMPIPRASWSEMLELILSSNGVGVKQLNPFLRQLYFFRDDNSHLAMVTNNRRDLKLLPEDARVCFVLSPLPQDVRRIWLFLEKFINPMSTILRAVGRDILVIGSVADINDLLKLYDFAIANPTDKDYAILPLKVDADEMAKILSAIFEQLEKEVQVQETTASSTTTSAGSTTSSQQPQPFSKRMKSTTSFEGSGLTIIPMKNITQAVFLVGTKEEIKRAVMIVRQVESQIAGFKEKVIYTYTTKHSDPDDLAKILDKVYTLMITTGAALFGEPKPPGAPPGVGPGQPGQDLLPGGSFQLSLPPTVQIPPPPPPPLSSQQQYIDGFYQEGGYIVNPAPIQPGVGMARMKLQSLREPDRGNFVVDAKSGSIIMVVEADLLPRLKELIKKIDIPKKMVRIECMLFEVRVNEVNNNGLNLLRIGDCASNNHSTCYAWNNTETSLLNTGVFQFLLSRKKSCDWPAFDLAYSFLLARDDISINATPSVVTLNQTTAVISINEEISINTGVFNVETAGGTTLKDAFTRAQYGITIAVTPTIHIPDDLEDFLANTDRYITLESDITFDTIQPRPDQPDRPDVVRRHITNIANIPDGETVILGGLRRKNTQDRREVIPFLGEIPGLGKLFSTNRMADSSTEMFIFLTPQIISNPEEQFERIKWAEMCRRPGDIPDFLCVVERINEEERCRLMAHAMDLLFGKTTGRCIPSSREFDGRY